MYVSQLRDPDHWRDYLDIDAKYYVLAGVYNAINDNTRGTGNWPKGKAPKFKPWPTPDILAKKAKAKPRSIDDLFVNLGGGRPVAPQGVLIIGQE